MVAPRPGDEAERLAALRSLEILDTPPEPDYDDLALLASQICGTSIALVSLVDADRQWFKARCGIDALETSREVSFCAHAICASEPIFVVEDARLDPRFAGSSLVTGEPYIRFYAGAVILDRDRRALGTVCVADAAARSLSPAQRHALTTLARQAGALLDMRAHALALARSQADLSREMQARRQMFANANDAIVVLDADLRVVEASRSFCALLGYTSAEVAGLHVSAWDRTFLPAPAGPGDVEGPSSAPTETVWRRKDGSLVEVRVGASNMPRASAEWHVLIGHDVSKRNRDRRELERSSARLSSLVAAQRQLSSTRASVDELLDQVPELALGVVHAEAALFELVDAEGLIVRSASAGASATLGMRTAMPASACGTAAHGPRTVVRHDLQGTPQGGAVAVLGACSALVTHLQGAQGSIGVLTLVSEEPRHFDAAEVDAIQLLGDAIAEVIQRKRADKEAQRSIEIQSGIVRLQQEIAASADDLQGALGKIVEHARTLTGASCAAVLFAPADDAVLQASAGDGMPAELARMVGRDTAWPAAMVTGQVQSWADLGRTDSHAALDAFGAAGLRSLAIAPLGTMAGPSGVLLIAAHRPRVFEARELGTLQILAEWLSVVVHHKQTLEHLRVAEAQYRRVFASSPLPMWVYDAETLRFLLSNEAATAQYGYDRDEFRSMRVTDLVSPAMRTDVDRYRAAHHADRQRCSPWELVAKDGSLVQAELSSSEIGYMNRPARVVFAHDITERVRVQDMLRSMNATLEARIADRTSRLHATVQALSSKEEEIRSVVENMADCVVTFADDGAILTCNPMVETVFGHARAALAGINIAALVPVLASRDELRQNKVSTVAGADAQTRQTEGLHRDGRSIALELAVSEYELGGSRRWTAILRDVGPRVAIMADLERARRDAEQASRAKSLFLATMSHELRTPMNGVIGMLDLLGRTALASDQLRMLGIARESASSLTQIIEGILEFSSIRAGATDLASEALSLRDVVRKACATVSSGAASRGASVLATIDPAIPALVLGDAARLHQVVVHLVSNAVKFSSTSGRTAEVRVEVRALSQQAAAVVVEIAIEDNGIGMDEQTLARIFKPFQQGDASITRRFGGTGLGLSFACHVVELMGGSIGVRSVPGAGSRFSVQLPMTVVGSLGAAAPRLTAPANGDTRRPAEVVLVVDDNLIERQIVCAQLETLGFAPKCVDHAEEALACWRTTRHAAIVSGLGAAASCDLARAIRDEEAEGARAPIICLTAEEGSRHGRSEAWHGVDDFLRKPVALASLAASLHPVAVSSVKTRAGL